MYFIAGFFIIVSTFWPRAVKPCLVCLALLPFFMLFCDYPFILLILIPIAFAFASLTADRMDQQKRQEQKRENVEKAKDEAISFLEDSY